MNPDELFALLLVIVIVAGVVFARRMSHPATAVRAAEADQLRDEVNALRERVQVLERVVTDTHGSADLDRRIEQLRDRWEASR